MNGARRSARHCDVAFDGRITSHMSAGMALYVRKLEELLPQVAPDLHFARVGSGDNFDLAEQIGLPLDIVRRRPRLVHVPTPFVPLLVPAPYILTIHDLIDLHYPQYGKRKVGPYYRFAVGPVARRACAVITDDPRTVDDLERFLGVAPRQIRVVPLGVDGPAAPPLRSTATPYFLYVGNHRGHKNLVTLVEAWAGLPQALQVDLIMTGHDDVGSTFAKWQRTNGKLSFTGDCSAAQLGELYRAAVAYVHPALREGFGLPMLEAMRAGVPVIAAASAVPSVLAPYAHAFGAQDSAELRGLLLHALDDRAPLRAQALAAQRATQQFTWERTARATADIYREFLP